MFIQVATSATFELLPNIHLVNSSEWRSPFFDYPNFKLTLTGVPNSMVLLQDRPSR
jgi:hypothetical protein